MFSTYVAVLVCAKSASVQLSVDIGNLGWGVIRDPQDVGN